MSGKVKFYKYTFKWRGKGEIKWHRIVGVGTLEQCEAKRREHEMDPCCKGFKVYRLANDKNAYLPY